MSVSKPQSRERRENPRLAILQHIYDRAGRITANKGQSHLRDFEEVSA